MLDLHSNQFVSLVSCIRHEKLAVCMTSANMHRYQTHIFYGKESNDNKTYLPWLKREKNSLQKKEHVHLIFMLHVHLTNINGIIDMVKLQNGRMSRHSENRNRQ